MLRQLPPHMESAAPDVQNRLQERPRTTRFDHTASDAFPHVVSIGSGGGSSEPEAKNARRADVRIKSSSPDRRRMTLMSPDSRRLIPLSPGSREDDPRCPRITDPRIAGAHPSHAPGPRKGDHLVSRHAEGQHPARAAPPTRRPGAAAGRWRHGERHGRPIGSRTMMDQAALIGSRSLPQRLGPASLATSPYRIHAASRLSPRPVTLDDDRSITPDDAARGKYGENLRKETMVEEVRPRTAATKRPDCLRSAHSGNNATAVVVVGVGLCCERV